MAKIDMESGLKGDNCEVHDFYLFAMGENVVHHLTGRAAQMLTRVIQHVVNVTGDRNVRLSEATQYAQTHGITFLANELMNPNLNVTDKPNPATMAVASADWVQKFPWFLPP
ncbi:hypothetical protein CC86DRAFT_413479 [Ophiobolus disseminans]|uniref:Uncharacterized protein n=1 Tax=Ophiobolus disseminans TaxID=1469910 RepID=A0A6A6ZEX1_9PLEO|nr:hypothetical protein CC86DRAFT_413479 [Ophiobolus disseminans]